MEGEGRREDGGRWERMGGRVNREDRKDSKNRGDRGR